MEWRLGDDEEVRGVVVILLLSFISVSLLFPYSACTDKEECDGQWSSPAQVCWMPRKNLAPVWLNHGPRHAICGVVPRVSAKDSDRGGVQSWPSQSSGGVPPPNDRHGRRRANTRSEYVLVFGWRVSRRYFSRSWPHFRGN